MRFKRISEDKWDSLPDGKYRIVRSSKGFTAWLRIHGQKKAHDAWKRLDEPYVTAELARDACIRDSGEQITTEDRKSLACQ